MAFSNLEKALMAWVGIETTRPGTLTPITRAAAKSTVGAMLMALRTTGRAAAPVLARGAVAAAPPVARALANPYVGLPLAAAAGTYGLQQYLEESGQQEAQNVRVAELMRFLEEDVPTAGRAFKKRRRSVYNQAMSKAMAAVKKSTKGGPKGALSNAKKTFGQVSKAVSKASKGGKLSTKGVTGVIKRSIAGIFKPKPKRKRISKAQYTFRTN